MSSATRSAAVTRPRLAIPAVSVEATAAATASGTWEPPGPSKWAAPAANAREVRPDRSNVECPCRPLCHPEAEVASRSMSNCLVTGASRGIGAAIAAKLAGGRPPGRGACQSGRGAAADRVRDGLAGYGHLTVTGDLTDPDTCARVVGTVVERFGELDVLVNNAGIYHGHPIARHRLPGLAAGLAADPAAEPGGRRRTWPGWWSITCCTASAVPAGGRLDQA